MHFAADAVAAVLRPWSYSALYMWWFCLRLMMLPVIEMLDRARTPEAMAAEVSSDTAVGEF